MREKRPVLLYGAGEHATIVYGHAVRQSEDYGAPAAFVDGDPYKQGHQLFGLPIISWQDAEKLYGTNSYIYVTGNEKAAPQMIGALLEKGTAKERIVNYEPVEKRCGCQFAESIVHPVSNGDTMSFYSCSRPADNGIYQWSPFRYIVNHEKAASVEEVSHGIEYLRGVAENIAYGKMEDWCADCVSGGGTVETYHYVQPKIRGVFFGGITPCNFKCSYCILKSSFYKTATYAPFPVFVEILQTMEQQNCITPDTFIKLCAGEFSVCEGGDRLVELAGKYPLCILTNAYKFSDAAAKAIEYSGMILCDLDSGTRETFRKVKGVDGFERVCEHLKEYAKHSSVCLKYILLDGVNDSQDDLDGFFEIADEIAVKVDLTRDFMNHTERFSDHALEFAARFIKHFRDNGKLNMSMAAFTRPGEEERLRKKIRELSL